MPRGVYERRPGLTRNTPPRLPLAERFWAKVDKGDGTGCWLWTGFIDKAGYGRLRIGGRETPVGYAHRVAYEVQVGPIPEGLTVDHQCHVTRCVRGDHLTPMTLAENGRGSNSPTALLARAGRCARGHDASESTRRRSNGQVVYCRACRRERRAADRAAREGLPPSGS